MDDDSQSHRGLGVVVAVVLDSIVDCTGFDLKWEMNKPVVDQSCGQLQRMEYSLELPKNMDMIASKHSIMFFEFFIRQTLASGGIRIWTKLEPIESILFNSYPKRFIFSIDTADAAAKFQ